MNRRQLLGLLAAAPLLRPGIALAQQVFVQVKAASGIEASVRRQGRRFLLEVSGFNIGMPPTLGFNIGMPPTAQLGNFEIQDLMGRTVEVALGGVSTSLVLGPGNTIAWRSGGQSGALDIEVARQGAVAGFLVIVTAAAAVAAVVLEGDR